MVSPQRYVKWTVNQPVARLNGGRMSRLNATHRFILAVLFTLFAFSIPMFVLIWGVTEGEMVKAVIGAFLNGLIGAILKDIYQFYFRTSSEAEKKDLDNIKKGGSNEPS